MATVKRLSRVARECNVGIHTIVEFLAKKGFDIENNPNSKVPQEALDLIMEAFQQDLTAKREAEKFTQEHRHEQKSSLSIEDAEKAEPVSDSDDQEGDDVLLIADPSVTTTNDDILPVKPKEPKKEKTEEKSVGPKIVGKIDLEKVKKPVEKPVEVKAEEPEKPKAPETPEVIEQAAPPKAPEAATPSEPEEESRGIKVVGKIDIDSLNQKTRPDKKKKDKEKADETVKAEKTEAEKLPEQQTPETKESVQDEKKPADEKIEKPEPKKDQPFDQDRRNRENDEVDIKTRVEKLAGPTVIGKIELPVEKKRTPAASSSDQPGKKKKRKRIRKDRVNVKSDDKVQTNRDDRNKPDNQAAKTKKGAKKRQVKTEVSDEDVQKQIKDTLARLTSKGGKSKASKHRRTKREAIRQTASEEAAMREMEDQFIKVAEFVTANELATLLNVPVNNIIATCMNLGMFVSINQRLDAETISLVAEEFGREVEFISIDLQNSVDLEQEESEEDLKPRPPIITVMGHVDHGKTSLLDYIRKTNVIAGEAGGITQHIGAYNVELSTGKTITFLDTPGHEAFTAMRARGAQVTDIAIIVVAADDAVMPQTIEAINHAAAAGVPIVFAINKIDKDGAKPERIKEELANMNYLVEEWGGKFQSHDISAKKGVGVDDLLEKVLLEAEMLDLKANPDKPAAGSVIEASLDKGRGYVTTLLVQSGTLKIGDIMLAGTQHGRVKAMFNERGKAIKQAGPAEPAVVLGLNGAPQAGDKFNILSSEREAREISSKREQLQREQEIRTQKHITLDEIGRRIAIGNFQELNVIVKGDVDGSIEALSDSLIKLSTEEIQVNVKHKAVGQISESDVLLAAASEAIIIGFQVRPSLGARKLAEKEGVDIRLYSIIYDAINEIRDAMEGMLSPEIKEEITGTLEILDTFRITKVGTVAGCIVRDGKIFRTSKVRIIREGIVVYDGDLGSLKRFKDDVKEVVTGLECGLNIENFNDIKVGDMIEAYTEKEIKKKL